MVDALAFPVNFSCMPFSSAHLIPGTEKSTSTSVVYPSEESRVIDNDTMRHPKEMNPHLLNSFARLREVASGNCTEVDDTVALWQ